MVISVLLTIIINFIVAYGLPAYPVDGNIGRYLSQNAGVSLWCAPVYLLNVYLGFRSSRFGENSSLLSFLVVNVIQLVLTPWELGASAKAIEDLTWTFGPWRYALYVLHWIVISSAIIHFAFSIWAIAVSSIAAHRGKVCCNSEPAVLSVHVSPFSHTARCSSASLCEDGVAAGDDDGGGGGARTLHPDSG